MKNIAILSENFITWTGGVDFLNQIIMALSATINKEKYKLFIFIPQESKYKKYKSVKRFIYKIIEKSFMSYKIIPNHKAFLEFEDIVFVEYSGKSLLKAILDLNIDILFPHLNPKYFDFPINTIGYFYDCQHKYYPDFFSPEDIKNRDYFFKSMLEKNKKVFVNANSVKDDVIRFFDANPQNILVLPFTPKIKHEYLQDDKKILEKYKLPNKYFAISNQFWRHKDHSTAFKAFEKLCSKYDDIGLVCTGEIEDHRCLEHTENLKRLIESLDSKEKIKFLGLIEKRDQIEILKNSLAVIQPSLFEGGPGGGAVWDAIALGVPSIISDITTNKEIKEENVFFFKASNHNDLSQKMEEFLAKEIIRPKTEDLIAKNNQNIQKLGNFLIELIES